MKLNQSQLQWLAVLLCWGKLMKGPLGATAFVECLLWANGLTNNISLISYNQPVG